MINKHRPRSVLRIFFTTSVETKRRTAQERAVFKTSAVLHRLKTQTGQKWKETLNKNTPKKRLLFLFTSGAGQKFEPTLDDNNMFKRICTLTSLCLFPLCK